MKITPLDITQKSFGRAMRGFERQEVEAFLALVASEFEGLVKEVQELRDGLAERILRAFPELLPDLPSRRFWASAHLLHGGPPPADGEVETFVQRTRQAQPRPLTA